MKYIQKICLFLIGVFGTASARFVDIVQPRIDQMKSVQVTLNNTVEKLESMHGTLEKTIIEGIAEKQNMIQEYQDKLDIAYKILVNPGLPDTLPMDWIDKSVQNDIRDKIVDVLAEIVKIPLASKEEVKKVFLEIYSRLDSQLRELQKGLLPTPREVYQKVLNQAITEVSKGKGAKLQQLIKGFNDLLELFGGLMQEITNDFVPIINELNKEKDPQGIYKGFDDAIADLSNAEVKLEGIVRFLSRFEGNSAA